MNQPTIQSIQDEIIAEIASILNLDAATLTPAIGLKEAGMDSIGLLELFIFVEKKYGVSLIAEAANTGDLSTIERIAQVVHRLIGEY